MKILNAKKFTQVKDLLSWLDKQDRIGVLEERSPL